MDSSHERIREAYTRVVRENVFFGTFAHSLEPKFSTEVPTAATNGKDILFNPEFLLQLTREQLYGLLLHEITHVAVGHHLRRGRRDAAVWNVACDYSINQILRDAGFTLPEGFLLDPGYRGLSAEGIYARIAARGLTEIEIAGSAMGQVEDFPDSHPLGSGTSILSEVVGTWQIQLAQAASFARDAGTLPGSLEMEVSNALKGKVHWTAVLAGALLDVVPYDFSYRRPNKLFSRSGIIFPSAHREESGPLVVAVDTSGSMWDQGTMDRIAAEIDGILASCDFPQVHVVSCDAQVQRVDVLERGDRLAFKPHGGGGTAFSPVFAHAEAEGLNPSTLVYLTDLESDDYPRAAPTYPVIWAAINAHPRHRSRVPFGCVVDIDPYA